jgi:uncharacterized protein
MNDLVVVGLAGFAASLVDGSLGMGFGPTSSSILLSSGLSPAGVSTTVNIAKVAAGIASGISHWKLGNIDRRLVARLALPGAFGALLGVTVLANVDAKSIRPVLAVLLIVVGLRILFRFARMASSPRGQGGKPMSEVNLRGTEVAAVAGGVTNGLIGAWGPVVTPFLMHRQVEPRITIGSVNTAEVAVATVAAGSLLASISDSGIDAGTVIAMLIGGVLGAPVAAWLIRFLPVRALGLAVAGLLLFTNSRELATWADLGGVRWVVYGAVVATVVAAAWLFGPKTPGKVPTVPVIEPVTQAVSSGSAHAD